MYIRMGTMGTMGASLELQVINSVRYDSMHERTRREESKVGGRDGGVEKWCEIEHFINTNKTNRPTGPSGKKMTWWGAAGIKFNIGSSSPSTANLWVCIDLDLSSPLRFPLSFSQYYNYTYKPYE